MLPFMRLACSMLWKAGVLKIYFCKNFLNNFFQLNSQNINDEIDDLEVRSGYQAYVCGAPLYAPTPT
jgi:hypothetical protein